jgi:lipopolysaccharide export system protein LptA
MNNKHLFSSSPLARLSLLTCLCLPVTQAVAEKADSQKTTYVSAEYNVYDGKKNTTTLSGNVELTRGTILVKAARAVATETIDKTRNFTLYGEPGTQVFFRQKRDGGPDLWLEGQADRVEYDDKTEMVKFISNAQIRYLEGKKITQEQQGEFLSYDSLNDVFVATNSSTGKHVPGAGRVTLTLEPKTEPKTASKTEAKIEAKTEKKPN